MFYIIENALLYLILIFLLVFWWGYPLSGQRKNILLSILTCVLGGILMSAYQLLPATASVSSGLCAVTSTIFLCLSMTFLFKVSRKEVLWAAFTMYFFDLLIENISSFLLYVFFGIPYVTDEISYLYLLNLPVCMLFYVAIYLFAFRKKGICLADLEHRYLLGVILQSLLFVFIGIIFLSMEQSAMLNPATRAIFAFFFLGMFFELYLTFHLAVKNTQLQEKNSQINHLLRENEKHLLYQQEQESELRSFRHDLKNHLSLIAELIQSEKYEELQKYMDSISLKLEETRAIHTNNALADALFSYYAKKAKKSGIRLSITGAFPSQIYIDSLDLCNLLGNLMMNAYEAAEKTTTKEITLTIKDENQLLCITEINSTADTSLISKKRDSKNHGIGIRTMHSVVNKYNGTLKYSTLSNADNNQVMVQITLENTNHPR